MDDRFISRIENDVDENKNPSFQVMKYLVKQEVNGQGLKKSNKEW
jgi:hypothetical protein